MNKTVVIVGVLDVKGSTNISQARSFLRFGFDVIPINYRTIINSYDVQFFENMLVGVVKDSKPALVVFSKCNGINPNLVTACREHSLTWLWNMDPIPTIKRCPEVIQHAKNANFASCTGGGVAGWFIENGVNPCFTLFDGLDYDIFKPVESVDKYKADISFIGSRTLTRNKYKKLLEDKGYNVKFYGMGYGDQVINDEFSSVCSSSKFMLSLNNEGCEDIEDYFSNRLLRYLGSGACVLHHDPTGTLDKYIKHGKEILYFKNEEELVGLIESTGVEQAGSIALRGMEKVLNTYTWDHTIQFMLTEISKHV